MEHYRRLGFADEVRALGMPPDFPTDIAYFTRFATHELARFSLPRRGTRSSWCVRSPARGAPRSCRIAATRNSSSR